LAIIEMWFGIVSMIVCL